MQEKDRYEYAVIRFVPRVEREEFVNVGLAMMCKRRRWMRVGLNLRREILKAFASVTDVDRLERQLQAFVDIAGGNSSAGPIAAFPVEERFRWLTAVKSCVIQTSRPHPGLTDDLEATFVRLMAEQVE